MINSSPESVISSKVPDHHLLPLFWCNNEKFADHDDDECGICFDSNFGTDYYFCACCLRKYHKECVESPLKIKNPYYPHHSPLELYYYKDFTDCIRCGTHMAHGLIYHCNVYQTFMHPVYAMKPIPIVIDQQKIHDHPLTFFPRQDFINLQRMWFSRKRSPLCRSQMQLCRSRRMCRVSHTPSRYHVTTIVSPVFLIFDMKSGHAEFVVKVLTVIMVHIHVTNVVTTMLFTRNAL